MKRFKKRNDFFHKAFHYFHFYFHLNLQSMLKVYCTTRRSFKIDFFIIVVVNIKL